MKTSSNCNKYKLVVILFKLLLLIAFLPALQAQKLNIQPVECEYEDWSLPGTAIGSLYQDEFGYIWGSASSRNIFRYDGQKIIIYSYEQGVPDAVREATLFQDKNGYLWVTLSTDQEDILVRTEQPLSPVHEADIQFKDTINQIPLLTSMDREYPVVQAAIDKNGCIWAANNKTITAYSYAENNQLQVDSLVLELSETENNAIQDLLVVSDGVLISTQNSIYKLQKNAQGIQVLQEIRTRLEMNLHHEDKEGKIWMSKSNLGVYRAQIDETLDSLYVDFGQYTKLPNIGGVRDMIALDEKNVLIASITGELLVYDITQDSITHQYSSDNLPETTIIFDLFQDSDNTIWLGHQTGLNKVTKDFLAFSSVQEGAAAEKMTLPSAAINGLVANINLRSGAKVDSGYVAACTSDGFAIFSPENEKIILGTKDGLESDIFLSVTHDNEGRIWFTDQRRINCLHPPNAKGDMFKLLNSNINLFGHPYHLSQLRGAILIPEVMAVPTNASSGEKKELLIGGSRSAFQILLDQNEWLWIRGDAGYFGEPMSPFLISPAGYLLIGSEKKLVRSIEPITYEYLKQIKQNGKAERDFLSSAKDSFFMPVSLIHPNDTISEISALYVGDILNVNKEIWLYDNTDSKIFVFDDKDWTIKHTIEAGSEVYANHGVFSKGKVWYSTPKGLLCINPKTYKVEQLIRESDGLEAEYSFSPKGLDADKEGNIYFATPDGMVIYRPHLDEAEKDSFPIHIANTTYKEDDWGNNEFSVRYTALAYREPESVTYRTKLAGYDKAWSETTQETALRYTNLSAFLFPKTYRFEVEAKDYREQWQQMETPYEFQVKPPLYARWWACLAYIVGLFFLFRSYLNYRLEQQAKDLALQEAEVIREQRDEIAAKNAQNELLLKEIHHRVKNNLEVVSSLLELQSAQTKDAEAQSVMQASQSRVQSMGIIHQKLYQGENLASIEMKDYFKNLCDSILDTYEAWDDVSIEYDMDEIELDVDTAVPIGLIVNELLTNALKYAFTDGEKGHIRLHLEELANRKLQLVVEDDGIGKAKNATVQGTGFGSQLIQLLTRQLNGSMREEVVNGTRFEFEFKPNLL